MSIGVDAPPVGDENEAQFLMLHHLKMAAMYFEATPTVLNLPQDEFSTVAMQAWAKAMEGLYPDD